MFEVCFGRMNARTLVQEVPNQLPPNHSLDYLPSYLRNYVVAQDPSLYTPMDHASWRFIMKIARAFFARHAHRKYLDGLRETGISTERIPLIEEMDARLGKFGWHAVAVSGFIPPAVFMEFLSRGILPIACDMRKLEHIAYTPAPDIVHEAAGHAPIIADPDYARYLHHYGELAEKAIFSAQDLNVYHAIRNLSEIKEDPGSTEEQIEAAQKRLDEAVASVDHVTEATQLGRMGWWTIEYGLIGDPSDPKIYGAGLLSSVGESYHCLDPKVKKLPLTVDCVDVSYDITRPQPQLFLAPDFETMTRVLDAFADRMAFRRGGVEGLEKARRSATTTTAQLDSGVQISGTLVTYETDPSGTPIYLKYEGPTQLSFEHQEIDGQGADYHVPGFSTVIGPLKTIGKSTAELSVAELNSLGFKDGKPGRMEFQSGVSLTGILRGTTARNGRNLILSFENCRVSLGTVTLFDPSWGTFDLACGSRVVSVFGGAADRQRYLEVTGGFKQEPRKPKCNLTPQNRALNELYAQVRQLRENGVSPELPRELGEIHEELERRYPDDWLLRYELLELDSLHKLHSPWSSRARSALREIARRGADAASKSELIDRGMALL